MPSIKVRERVFITGVGGRVLYDYEPDGVYEVTDDVARKWIGRGVAVLVEAPATKPSLESVSDDAAATGFRKRRTRTGDE